MERDFVILSIAKNLNNNRDASFASTTISLSCKMNKKIKYEKYF